MTHFMTAAKHLRSALRLLDVPAEGDASAQAAFRARSPDVLRRQMESAAREIKAAMVAGDAGLRSLAEAVVAEYNERPHNAIVDGRTRALMTSESLDALRDALSVGKRPKSS